MPFVVLSTVAGFQEPVIPLLELPGKTGTVPPAQIVREVPKLNVGVMFGSMVTEKTKGVVHCPAVGVKV